MVLHRFVCVYFGMNCAYVLWGTFFVRWLDAQALNEFLFSRANDDWALAFSILVVDRLGNVSLLFAPSTAT